MHRVIKKTTLKLSIFFFLIFSIQTMAQKPGNGFCNHDVHEHINKAKKFDFKNPTAQKNNSTLCVRRDVQNRIPVEIIVEGKKDLEIYKTLGEPFTQENIDHVQDRIRETIQTLNNAFEPIGFSFYLTDDIKHYEDKRQSFRYVNTLKIRYFSELPTYYGFNSCASFRFLPEKNLHEVRIAYTDRVCSNDFANKGENLKNMLLHEIGHYFGLHHTFYLFNDPIRWERADTEHLLANGNQSCTNYGDGFCDTNADPKISRDVIDFQDCQYNGVVFDGDKQKEVEKINDANGSMYNPPISNYMSYSPQECQNKFSNDQYQYMKKFAEDVLFCQTNDFNEHVKIETVTYPNPFTDTINIHIRPVDLDGLIDISSVYIVDSSGKTVMTVYDKSSDSSYGLNFTLDASGLAKGMYFVQIVNGRKKITNNIAIQKQ